MAIANWELLDSEMVEEGEEEDCEFECEVLLHEDGDLTKSKSNP